MLLRRFLLYTCGVIIFTNAGVSADPEQAARSA
jgi:hypothetical protein